MLENGYERNLVFAEVAPSDFGTYECVIVSGGCDVQKVAYDVTVEGTTPVVLL